METTVTENAGEAPMRRGGVRQQARAAAAKRRGDRVAQMLERERQIAKAVADYVEAGMLVSDARDTAQSRAQAAIQKGEEKAARHDERASEAVKNLKSLGLARGQIAELCSTSPVEIRQRLAA